MVLYTSRPFLPMRKLMISAVVDNATHTAYSNPGRFAALSDLTSGRSTVTA